MGLGGGGGGAEVGVFTYSHFHFALSCSPSAPGEVEADMNGGSDPPHLIHCYTLATISPPVND